MGFAFSELGSEFGEWTPLSLSLLTVLISIIILRGSFSILFDFVRVLRRLVSTQYVNKGTQTEPYYNQLPTQLWVNPGSEVFHTEGCHYIGLRGKARSSCILCRNRW